MLIGLHALFAKTKIASFIWYHPCGLFLNQQD